jgi:hypothetical protein
VRASIFGVCVAVRLQLRKISMTIRAKFKLHTVKHSDFGNNYGSTELVFHTEYDSTIEEDRRFTKETPNGNLTMTVDNPVALEYFKASKTYYLDFSEAN